MPDWQREITYMRVLEVRPGSMEIGRAGKIPREIIETMRKQLEGDGWEVANHSFSKIDDEVILSILWRRLNI